jgi:hypothetical protein
LTAAKVLTPSAVKTVTSIGTLSPFFATTVSTGLPATQRDEAVVVTFSGACTVTVTVTVTVAVTGIRDASCATPETVKVPAAAAAA